MNNKQVQDYLDCIIKSRDPDKFTLKILSLIPTLKEESLREILDYLKQVLFSKHQVYTSKAQVLLLLRHLNTLPNLTISNYTNKKIVGKLEKNYLDYENITGFELWAKILTAESKEKFEFIILVLQSIETWAESYNTDMRFKSSQFYSVYQSLKSKDFEFPPSFLFRTPSEIRTEKLKKDLHRCRKLSKEIRRSFSVNNKKKLKVLSDLAEIYQRYIELEIDKLASNRNKVSEDLILTYSDLTQVLNMCNEWKNNGYSAMPEKGVNNNNCQQIEDILPKNVPLPDDLSRSLEKISEDSIKLSEREENTFREELDQSADIYKLKEKIMDNEDLIQMYKSDLGKLQVKYLEVTEQKEEMILRINAILFSNREMNKILTESKKAVEVLTAQNYSLSEDLEAYKSQNDCLKSSIREIQDSLIKLEKDSLKNKKYTENLENLNTALTFSNQTLKSELEKSKTIEQALLIKLNKFKPPIKPEIFMNPKLKGDIESSGNINISDLENEKSPYIDEENKSYNIPSKINSIPLENSDEMNLIPNMQLIKPENIQENKIAYKGDNFLLYKNFLRSRQGLIFEDDKIQIGLRVTSENEECWGVMSIGNKTFISIEMNLDLISYSEALSPIMIPCGNISLKASGLIQYQVYARSNSAYLFTPLLKLSYRNTLTEKFFRLPIAYPLFFNGLENIIETYEALAGFETVKLIQKLKLKPENFEDLVKLTRIHEKFEVLLSKKSFYLGATTNKGPVVVKVTVQSSNLCEVSIRCEDKVITKILAHIISEQLEDNLS
jgi:hypothetical protein